MFSVKHKLLACQNTKMWTINTLALAYLALIAVKPWKDSPLHIQKSMTVFFSKDISCTTLRLHFHCIYYYKVACRRSELSSNWSITGIKRTQFRAESTLTDGRVSSRYFNPKRHSCYIEKGRSNWIFLSTCLSGRRLWVFVPRLGWVQSQLILPALPCGSGSGVSLLCSQP